MKKVWDIPEVEHRVKPPGNAMIWFPTAHGPYTRTSLQVAQFKRERYGYYFCHGELVRARYTDFSYVLFYPELVAIQHPSGWWTRPLWDAIQDSYVDISDTVAEYDQVAGMFVQAVKAVDNMWRCLRRGRCKGFVTYNVLGWLNVPSAWLWYSFGVRPLVETLKDAYEEFSEASFSNLHKVRLVDKREATRFAGLNKSKTESKQVVKAYWLMETKTSLGALALGEPARWAWERLPFSFVVDWLLPIGGALAAAEAKQHVIIKSAVLTQKQSISTQRTRHTSSSFTKVSAGRATTFNYVRWLPDIELDYNSYMFARPVYFGSGRAKNALAVLANVSRQLRR
jgi:hypothetical protein